MGNAMAMPGWPQTLRLHPSEFLFGLRLRNVIHLKKLPCPFPSPFCLKLQDLDLLGQGMVTNPAAYD